MLYVYVVLNKKYVRYQCYNDFDFDVLQNVIVYFDGYFVDSMVIVVVYDGVGKYEYYISLEFGCRSDRIVFDVFFDLIEIYSFEREKLLINY